MDIRSEAVSPGLNRVWLEGRLDTPGVDQVETRFNAMVVASGREVMVDLSAVNFLSSMGVRMLVTAARAMTQRQKRLVLFAAQPLVAETLHSMAVDTLMAVVADEGQARAILATP